MIELVGLPASGKTHLIQKIVAHSSHYKAQNGYLNGWDKLCLVLNFYCLIKIIYFILKYKNFFFSKDHCSVFPFFRRCLKLCRIILICRGVCAKSLKRGDLVLQEGILHLLVECPDKVEVFLAELRAVYSAKRIELIFLAVRPEISVQRLFKREGILSGYSQIFEKYQRRFFCLQQFKQRCERQRPDQISFFPVEDLWHKSSVI